jgi:hypothetical protein
LYFCIFGSGEFEDIMLRIPPNISSNPHPFFDKPSGEYLSGIPSPYLTSLLLRLAGLLISQLPYIYDFPVGIPNRDYHPDESLAFA